MTNSDMSVKRSTTQDPQTVLELYDRAYEFHYEKKRPARAARIYREIIRNFPSSNECAYAAIQLEKLAAAKVLKRVSVDAKPRVPAWIIALLLFNLLVTLLVTAAFFMYISTDIKSIIPAIGIRGQEPSASSFVKQESEAGRGAGVVSYKLSDAADAWGQQDKLLAISKSAGKRVLWDRKNQKVVYLADLDFKEQPSWYKYGLKSREAGDPGVGEKNAEFRDVSLKAGFKSR